MTTVFTENIQSKIIRIYNSTSIHCFYPKKMKKNYSTYKKTYYTLAFFIVTFFGYSQITQTYTSSGTFTVPAGVITLTVEAWGGGGAGGGCTTLNKSTGGGGAGGTYTKNMSVSVTPGAVISVTIGAGGIGVSAANGGTGGTSTFASTTPVTAIGGGGGSVNGTTTPLNGLGAVSAIGTTYNGGAGGVGNATPTVNGTSGGGGGGAGSTGSGAAPSLGTNAGIGGTGGGGAGAAGAGNPGPGDAAIALSGGGSGGRNGNTGSNRTGGNGFKGQIIISWNAPEININGNAVSIIDGDATPIPTDWTDFGSMETSTGTITKTYTIQNTGNILLTIGAITISGVNASDFTLATSPSASIVAGGSTTFSVRFDPNSLGLKTAAISIVNDDANENPYNFSIQGTGIQTFFDSDGDGVYDNFDIDDDNDGVLDATEETNCNSSNGHKVDYKFLNETFGTGGRTSSFTAAYNATTTYCYENGTGTNCPAAGASWILDDGEYSVVSKITGTVASDPENIHGDLAWYNGEDHTTGDTSGRMAVFNASFTPGTFYETTITGILSNLPITYSFWVLNIMAQSTFPSSILPNVTVEFYDLSNNLLTSFNTGDIGRCTGSTTDNTCSQGVWKQFTTSVNLGNVNAFTIRFKNNAPGGGGNDLALDDILISQTLCDLDNDGVADMFDLDADNDGIEDVIEAGLGSISDGKGKVAVTWVDANGNGLLDSAEATAALPALDSDGDGRPNYIDLDSDNDSLFDVDESGAGNTNATTGFINGDGDINGDGTGDGPESETFRSKDINGDGITELFGDGILDLYDYGTGANQYGNLNQGTANLTYPAATFLLDSDNDGIPNYIDVNSNGATFDIANTLLIYDYKTLDINNNGTIDGSTDIDFDGILDVFDTNTAYFGSPRDLHTKLFLDFDGRNDYGQSTAILGGLANASLMGWIDLNPAFSTEGIVVGQDKFQLRITSARKLEAVVNGTSVTFNTALSVSQWYHVAATYGGGFLKIYLNGTLVATQAATGNIAADASLLSIGKNPIANTKYFKGKIDEVRVFNVTLTDSQLQRMVYQEIQDTGSQVRGAIVPKDVGSLPFANVLRYYRMDVYKDDIIDDLTTTATDLTGAKIYNNKNIYVQQAPMPFLTERTGNFTTAVNSPTKEIRGDDIMENDWSIVKVQHDITETANNIDLGMFVDSGKIIVMNNDTKIQNDWYLKLDGKIDLVGKSQLVQTLNSDLDVTSAGSIERDQQGQSSLYNYNYWSSPVSPINITANNTNYTVNGMLKDGTTTTPQNINWIGGYNGAATTPISIARYWLFKFDNYGNAYANWSQITENGALRVGQAFTMKGTGAASGTQNYTFTGKPNSGSIATNTISANQLLLLGNPYPSALDAAAFITDNANSIDGTLYFWEHYATNNTHDLRDYQGGYAERNLTGGVAPVAPALISGLGSSTKIPRQFIPSGQGFFVNGKTGSTGTVTFNNGQRGFHKEDEVGVSNNMFKPAPDTKKSKSWDNNNNDPVAKEEYMKIRLGFNSHNKYHREVLLGFMNEKATSGMDYGYEGYHFDNFPNDMYFLNGKNKLVIQGEGFFNEDASYPIGVKTDALGMVSFSIDELENFDKNQKIYIYDKVTDTHHTLKNKLFEIELPAGTFNDRFYLRFKNKKDKHNDKTVTDKIDITSDGAIQVSFTNSNRILTIINNDPETTVSKVFLYNILGQIISKWDTANKTQTNIQIPIQNINSGIYIAKLQTSKEEISTKIIIP